MVKDNCDKCGVTFTADRPMEFSRDDNGTPITVCAECRVSWRPASCGKCGTAFDPSKAMPTYISVEDGGPAITCEKCGASFTAG